MNRQLSLVITIIFMAVLIGLQSRNRILASPGEPRFEIGLSNDGSVLIVTIDLKELTPMSMLSGVIISANFYSAAHQLLGSAEYSYREWEMPVFKAGTEYNLAFEHEFSNVSSVTGELTGEIGTGGKVDEASAAQPISLRGGDRPSISSPPLLIKRNRTAMLPKVAYELLQTKRFKNIADFSGSYQGYSDGKPCQMDIESTLLKDGDYSIHIEFKVGQTNYRTNLIISPPKPEESHILKDIELQQVGGTGHVHFKYLLLHTWDIDYLSGVTVWNDREFGASFQRTP